MKSGIYIIQNKINGKRYIGSAKDFELRCRVHKNCLRKNKHCNRHLQQAWNKYGELNFIFSKIAECPVEYLLKLEQWFLDNLKPEYNICKVAGNTLGVPMLPHVKAAIKKGKENYIMTEETKLRMRQAQLGRKMKKESIDKALSTKRKRYGDVMPKESRDICNKKISEALKGKTLEYRYGIEEANRRKIEIAMKSQGRVMSDTLKEKLSVFRQERATQIKGKSYIEIYGEDKSNLIKQKISKASQRNKFKSSITCKKTFTGLKQSPEHINKRISKRKIQVKVTDLSTNTETIFNSIKEVIQKTEIAFATIKSAILSGKTVHKKYKFAI